MARITVEDCLEMIPNRFQLVPVFYTHLTLPTNRWVEIYVVTRHYINNKVENEREVIDCTLKRRD